MPPPLGVRELARAFREVLYNVEVDWQSLANKNFETPVWLHRIGGLLFTIVLVYIIIGMSQDWDVVLKKCQIVGIGYPGFICVMGMASYGFSLFARQCYQLTRGNKPPTYGLLGIGFVNTPMFTMRSLDPTEVWFSLLAMPILTGEAFLGTRLLPDATPKIENTCLDKSNAPPVAYARVKCRQDDSGG